MPRYFWIHLHSTVWCCFDVKCKIYNRKQTLMLMTSKFRIKIYQHHCGHFKWFPFSKCSNNQMFKCLSNENKKNANCSFSVSLSLLRCCFVWHHRRNKLMTLGKHLNRFDINATPIFMDNKCSKYLMMLKMHSLSLTNPISFVRVYKMFCMQFFSFVFFSIALFLFASTETEPRTENDWTKCIKWHCLIRLRFMAFFRCLSSFDILLFNKSNFHFVSLEWK